MNEKSVKSAVVPENSVPLKIRLFGAPEVEAGGRPLPLNNQKARALLFYLAVTRQPHTRSHLATLLWSEFPAGNARRSLRVTLFQLRRALQMAGVEEVLKVEGDLLELQVANNSCDISHFCHLLDQGSESALAEAVNLYRGSFLEGFSLPDTPLFDEWVRLEDEKLMQAYLNALGHLAGAAEACRKWDRALDWLQRLVQADPLAESAQQQLIGLYLKTGATGKAWRQYQQFEAEMLEKLGLQPAPETQKLVQEGLQQHQRRPAAKKPSRTDLRSRRRPALPFVGRDRLLAQMRAISSQVKDGHGATLLLQGDGGIGKTRLLQEFLAVLGNETPRWLVLQGACSPFDDLISYGPFLEAFRQTAVGDLTDLLLAHDTEARAARDHFVYRILQTLRRYGQNAPLVLAIDDLQWANSSTLNLFGLLATRLHDLPLLLVGTVQRPEVIPALQRLITIERRRGQLQLLSLSPLTEAAVGEMLAALAINPASIASLAHWLQARSDGNPFVLDEIVAQLHADNILTPVGNEWHLDPGRWLRWRAAYTLPETTHDLVSWRLRNLTVEAHALLDVLAVAGQPLPYALLLEFPGFSVGHLLPIIDDLLARRLLVETGHEMFALSHDLLRETVLHRLSHVRRRVIHRQLAQTLARCSALEKTFPLWEVARHAVAGEDVELARRYGLQILSQLPQAYTGAATVDFLHHLVDLLAPSAAPEEMLRLTRVIGDVHQSLGHLSQATYWQEQYLALAHQTGDVAAQAIAHLEKGELALVSNDYVAATSAAKAGLEACALLLEHDPAFSNLSGRAHRLLGHALAMEGNDLAAAERHLQQATAAHRLAENKRDLCASLFELGNVAAQRGQLRRALAFYNEAAVEAERGQAHYYHALAYNNIAYHSLLLGHVDAAQQALRQGQKLAERYDLLGAFLHLSSTQGEIHLYLGEWAAAAESFQRGLTLAEELANLERQAGYRAGLALAARGQQDLARAIQLLEEGLILIDDRGYLHLRTRLLIWLAETLLADGQVEAAQAHLQAALSMAEAHGRALLRLQAGRLRASLLAATGDWPAAEACFAEVMAQATELDLPPEIARTQAAWDAANRQLTPEITLP